MRESTPPRCAYRLRPFMPTRAPPIPAACNVSAARRHVLTTLLPATVTPGHSSAEDQGAISPILIG